MADCSYCVRRERKSWLCWFWSAWFLTEFIMASRLVMFDCWHFVRKMLNSEMRSRNLAISWGDSCAANSAILGNTNWYFARI